MTTEIWLPFVATIYSALTRFDKVSCEIVKKWPVFAGRRKLLICGFSVRFRGGSNPPFHTHTTTYATVVTRSKSALVADSCRLVAR